MKFALKQVERRTNIAIRFEKAEGSLWSGRLYLKNLSVARQDHPCSRFEIEGDHVEVRLSVTKLFFGSNELQTVRITGFRGTWEQVGKAEKLKPRRLFRIDRLVLEDVQLDFADHTRGKNVFEAKINIDYLESSPLRSQWAVFDVLFRSNATGKINGVPFEIDSEKGRHFFRMEDVPIRLFSAYFDLLRWCDEGKVDLLIDNTFAGDEFVMRWSVVFREIHAKVPDEADLKTKALAMPLVTYINLRSKRLPLEFELRREQEKFRYSSSEELSDGVRAIFGDKIIDALKNLIKHGEAEP